MWASARSSTSSAPTPGTPRTSPDWLKDAEINRDRNLRLQYLAGLENNQYQADAIYRQILAQRRAPDPHITADSATMQALRARLGQPDLDAR